MNTKLIKLLTFMGNEEVKELALKVISNDVSTVSLTMLFPFLSSSDLDEIVQELILKNKSRQIISALPFVSSKTMSLILEKIKSGELTDINETALYPFLNKDQLKSLFNDLVTEMLKEEVEEEIEEPTVHFEGN